MAAKILTENLIACFLILSDGDVSISVKDALTRLYVWEEENDRHFGIDRFDIYIAFQNLWFIEKYGQLKITNDFDKDIKNTSLADWMPHILIFSDIYCNDESSHWTLKWDRRKRLPDGQQTSWRNWQLRQLFSAKKRPSPAEVMCLFNKWQVSPQSMWSWSRPGKSS